MVQTYTHAALGAAIASTVVAANLADQPAAADWLPESVWVAGIYLVAIAGAVTPDVPMFVKFLWDKWRGVQLFMEQGPLLMVLKEGSHSLPLWLLAWVWAVSGLVVSHQTPLYPAFLVSALFVASGILAGVLPDIPTHSEERFRDTDCTFLWPLPGSLRWPNEKWEYRYDHGVVTQVKPFELTLIIGSLAYAVAIPLVFG